MVGECGVRDGRQFCALPVGEESGRCATASAPAGERSASTPQARPPSVTTQAVRPSVWERLKRSRCSADGSGSGLPSEVV